LSASNPSIRVLCLGNDILADDGVGPLVAKALKACLPDEIQVVDSCEAGFHLMDYLMDVERVIVVDAIQTGREKPGTVYHVREEDLPRYQGNSPHYVGLFESLALGKMLEIPIARELEIVAVETADCRTLGGAMHPDVTAAVPRVVSLVEEIVSSARAPR
jgi:hydrogenase maturation protease